MDFLNQYREDQALTEEERRYRAARRLQEALAADLDWKRAIAAYGAGLSQGQRGGVNEEGRRAAQRVYQQSLKTLEGRYGIPMDNFMRIIEAGDPILQTSTAERVIQAFDPFSPHVRENAAAAGRAIGDFTGTYVPLMGFLGPPVRSIGRNVVGATVGSFEPFQLPGDWLRQFTMDTVTGTKDQAERETFQWVPEPLRPAVRAGAATTGALLSATEKVLGDPDAPTFPPEVTNFMTAPEPESSPWAGVANWMAEQRGMPITPQGLARYAPSLIVPALNIDAGVSPYENPNLASGQDVLEEIGLYEALNVDDPRAKALLGLGAEMLLDPFTLVDFAFGASKALRVARLPAAADQMNAIGRALNDAVSPVGAARGVGRAASALGFSDAFGVSVQNVLRGWLDAPIPRTSAVDRSMMGKFGVSAGNLREDLNLNIRLRDLIFSDGVSPIDGPDNRWLYGGRDLGANEALAGTVGQATIGRVREARIQQMAVRGLVDLQRAIISRLGRVGTLRVAGGRLVIPNARKLTDAQQQFRNIMSRLAGQFVENVGIGEAPKHWSAYLQRARDAAELYGMPDEVLGSVENILAEGVAISRRTVMNIGMELSRYEEFRDIMRYVAESLGEDPDDIIRLFELRSGGVDLAAYLDSDIGRQAIPSVPDITHATQRLDAFEAGVKTMMEVQGFNPTVSPLRFLRGLREGYLRRVIGARVDPDRISAALTNKHLLLISPDLQNMDPMNIIEDMRVEFGDAAARGVEGFFATQFSDGGAIPVDNIAQIVSAATGETLNAKLRERVHGVVYQRNEAMQFLQKTIADLQQGAPGPGFQPRQELSDAALASLVRIEDAEVQIAELGRVGGRQARVDHVLDASWAELTNRGVVLDTKTTGRYADPAQLQRLNRLHNKEVVGLLPFQGPHGEQYVYIPKVSTAWGRFAGTAIPVRVAEDMLRVLAQPAQMRVPGLSRMLSGWRMTLLASPATTVRNMLSNIVFIGRAGGDIPGVLSKLPQAWKLRREYLETGRLRGYEGAENMLTFFNHGSLTRDVSDGIAGYLEDAARLSSDLSGPSFPEKLQNLLGRISNDARFFGFLGAFGAFEETSRLAAMIWAEENLRGRVANRSERLGRAAHFANHAAYDYSSTPVLPRILQEYGLSAFPQFSWFNAGRFLRTSVERPQVFQKMEYARLGINTASVPDEDEQMRISTQMSDFLKSRMPLVTTLLTRDGAPAVIDLASIFPTAIDGMSYTADIFQAGTFRPWAELASAWVTGTGEATFSMRYGERVFEPAQSFFGRAVSSAQFMARQYIVPAHLRAAQRLVETGIFYENAEASRRFEMIDGRFQNQDWRQVVASMLGISSYRVDPPSGVNLRQQLESRDREEGTVEQSFSRLIDQQIESAFRGNDNDRLRVLLRLRLEFQRASMQQRVELLKTLRDMQR